MVCWCLSLWLPSLISVCHLYVRCYRYPTESSVSCLLRQKLSSCVTECTHKKMSLEKWHFLISCPIHVSLFASHNWETPAKADSAMPFCIIDLKSGHAVLTLFRSWSTSQQFQFFYCIKKTDSTYLQVLFTLDLLSGSKRTQHW